MSNCSKCGSCEDCGCVPHGMTTPNYCPSDLPPCPQPSPCNETFDSKCVIYTGDNLPCIGAETGNSVEEVILSLNTKLIPFFCIQCVSLVVPANASTGIPNNQTLTWNIVPGATSYDVYFGTSSTNPPLVSAGQIMTSYTSPYPLLPNTTYYWKVVPKNSGGAASNCPIFNFSTVALACVNPLSYMLDYVKRLQTGAFNVTTFIQDLNDYLTEGELITNCNFCCPDCTQTKRYVLASAPVYAAYYNQFYDSPNCLPVCCTEVDASLTAMALTLNPGSPSLATAFAALPPVTNCCGTNFSECSQKLKLELGTAVNTVYQGAGIVEESTINDTTELCILTDFLDTLTGITDADKANIVVALLTRGFVVQCRPEGTIIASVQAYTTYITAAQSGCLCYKPC